MIATFTPREFTKLVNWCETPAGKHRHGGIQDRRRKWMEQLHERGVYGPRVRVGDCTDADRWLELDEGDIAVIKNLRANPGKGSWQRDMLAIFGGVPL